jgi:hypothetical protein
MGLTPYFQRRPLNKTAAALCVLLGAAPCARAQREAIPTDVASSVDRGLAWLAREQDASGSWAPASGGMRSTAITGLCAMAFMARGHVPGQGPYGEHLNRAVDYVIAQQRDGGILADRGQTSPMYDHGISTIMLCEAYGMLDEKRQDAARTAISRAVRVILNAQDVRKTNAKMQGGWRYTPTSEDSDISVTGWQLMALRAAANVGANIPPEAIRQGIAYIRNCANDDGGFGYMTRQDGVSTHARTGTGVLALFLLGEEDDPLIKSGASYLITRPRALLESAHHFYTLYYCAQAAWQLGGPHWTQINADVSADLRRRQGRDGSWSSSGTADGQGPNYATAMAILALTVPYRYLPLYQR